MDRIQDSAILIKKRKRSIPSTHEMFIMKYLDRCGVKYEREYYNENLFNPKTDKLLFIDFYLPDLNSAIEFDGSHHYSASKRKGIKCLEDQQYRDTVKNKYCEQVGIELLRITTFVFKEIEVLLDRFLNLNDAEKINYHLLSKSKNYLILNLDLVGKIGVMDTVMLTYLLTKYINLRETNALGAGGSFSLSGKELESVGITNQTLENFKQNGFIDWEGNDILKFYIHPLKISELFD